ncbi:MAG: 1-acyl-sn-glycerol-3-phosphate acyltransferase [bacterium]
MPTISAIEGQTATLDIDDVNATDWLPGTVHAIYGTRDPAEIVVKEHIAATHHVHPHIVPAGLPLQRFDLEVSRDDGLVISTGDAHGTLDITPVREFWTKWFNREPWPVEDMYYGLIERFVNRVILTDPAAFEAQRGKSLLYLGNHQVGVESLLFSIIASGLNEVPTVTLAKIEHKETWLGRLIDLCFRYPGVADPKVITFFDRDDKQSLPNIIKELAAEMMGPGRSVMVHVEGTRSLTCRTPVEKMSGAFIDMALGVNAPVVPIRFVGGLPVDPLETRLEFPVGMGRQDIYIGRPILPEELNGMPYGDRKKVVVNAINALGPSNAIETPLPGDPAFDARVNAYLTSHDVSHEHATLATVLTEQKDTTEAVKRVLGASAASELNDGSPEGVWLEELATRLLGR